MSTQKVWFVTGASKGMGLALVKLLLAAGNRVAATSRDIAAFNEHITAHQENFLPLAVDIASDGAVTAAIRQTVEKFGRLDVVVNNAGYSLVGSMEETTDEEFRATVDVNLFGTVNTIRAAMPFFRAQQSGHFINISSVAGYVGFGKAASYNASKFAVIGLSDALADETKEFGIKVTVVSPGQFRTNFMNKGSLTFTQNRIDVYKIDEAENYFTQFSGQQQGDPEKLVRIIADIADHPNPPLHLLLGPDAYDLVIQQRLREKEEFEAWKEVTSSTDFDS